MLNIA
jgi:hypothetical protein